MSEIHPSAGRRAELIWEGKYDASGKRVAPLRVQLPFQTVEMVNESAQERQKALSLFESPGAYLAKEWRNRLIWGDKKYVLPALLAEYAGKVNLIYIDPPFDTGADFSFTATVPDDPDSSEDDSFAFTKQPSIIEQKAYRDTWGRGIDSYLQWFNETAIFLHELLHEEGSLYVHLDYHVAHYAKTVLDEAFGQDNFKNEIVWKRSLPHNDPKKYGAIHDTILFYVKSQPIFIINSSPGLASNILNLTTLRRTKKDENISSLRWRLQEQDPRDDSSINCLNRQKEITGAIRRTK
jgi:adenine specific DNA methylase Mod